MPGTVRKAARLHKALIQVQTCAAQGKFAEAFQRFVEGKFWPKRKREGQSSKDLKEHFGAKGNIMQNNFDGIVELCVVGCVFYFYLFDVFRSPLNILG